MKIQCTKKLFISTPILQIILVGLFQSIITMYDLHEFLEPINVAALNDDGGYNDGQFASHINAYEDKLPDLTEAEIILVGINEGRNGTDAADAMRKQFYQLHYWHTDVRIMDIGNIKSGATIPDSYAAVKTVLAELFRNNKTAVILGGTHDFTLAQYFAYKELQQVIEATVIDSMIDLKSESAVKSDNFLMEMLTSEPNLVKHYNHIGFQSYYVHPRMLETMDKLRFDCYRVGIAKERIEEMEPVLRNTNLLSIDISAIKSSDAPSSKSSPNGFSGEEACILTRYAGMSSALNSIGFYGYNTDDDVRDQTAKQISQMLWYFIEGKSRAKQEALMNDRHNFNEFHTAFTDIDTVFLQSKKTGRWWMQLPDKKMIACSYNDYVNASNNEIPERWLRAQERSL